MGLATPRGFVTSVLMAAWIATAGCSTTNGGASGSNKPDANAAADPAGSAHSGANIDAGHAAKPGTTMTSTHDSGNAAPADSGRADASRAPTADASSAHPRDAGAEAAHDAGMRRGLRGAFLELSNDHPASLYRDAITEMAELGMDIAVVQTESYLEQPNFTRNPVDRNLLRAVLDQAASSAIRVHLGLALPEWGNGDETLARDSTFVDGAIAASKTSLDMLLADFAGHAAWAGCYLSIELWTPGSRDQLGELPRYVREVSRYVKQQGALEVSMSPFVSALATDGGASTRAAFSALFADAEVDLVALQDGAGARDLSLAQLAGNVPYYQAMIDACASHCQAWANIEAFAPDQTSATTWMRFDAQMQTLAPVVPNQITYEYTNYLMSSGAATGASALHSAYASWLRGP